MRSSGQVGRAEPLFLKLLEQSPDAETYTSLFQLYQANREPLGGMTRVLEMFDEAVARSSEAVEKKKSDSLAIAQARGMLAALRDDRDLAKGLVTETLVRLRAGRDLQSTKTLEFLAALAARSKQLDEAEAFYRHCLTDSGPSNLTEPTVYQGLLEVLMQAKKYDAVIEVARQGVAQAKATNLLIFYDYSIRALLNTGEFGKALEQCELAVPISASDERNYLRFRLLRLEALGFLDKFPAALAKAQSLLKEFVQPDQVRLFAMYFRMSIRK